LAPLCHQHLHIDCCVSLARGVCFACPALLINCVSRSSQLLYFNLAGIQSKSTPRVFSGRSWFTYPASWTTCCGQQCSAYGVDPIPSTNTCHIALPPARDSRLSTFLYEQENALGDGRLILPWWCLGGEHSATVCAALIREGLLTHTTPPRRPLASIPTPSPSRAACITRNLLVIRPHCSPGGYGCGAAPPRLHFRPPPHARAPKVASIISKTCC